MWILPSLVFAFWNGISLPLTKKVIGSMHPIAFIVVSNVFLLFCMLIFFLIHGFPRVTILFVYFVLAAGILDAIAFVMAIFAVKSSEVSLIAPLSTFSPLFTIIIGMLTLHEIPTPGKCLGVLFIMLGAYTLNISQIKHGIDTPLKKLFSEKGVWLYASAFFIWSITPIFQKAAIFQTHPQQPFFVAFIDNAVITILLFPFLFSHWKGVKKSTSHNFFLLLILGIGTSIAQFAAYNAFATAPVGYVTAIMRTSVFFTILIGGLFLQEKHLRERLFGAGIMILGTLFLAL